MDRKSIHTKVMWSVEGRSMRSGLVEELSEMRFDALRVIFSYEHQNEIGDFLRSLKSHPAFEDIPVLLDLSQIDRTIVRAVKRDRDLRRGEKITIAMRDQGDHSLILERLGKVITPRKDDVIMVDYGTCLLTVLEVTGDILHAEVTLGGRVREGMDVRVASQEEWDHSSLVNLSLTALKGIDLEGVIVPISASAILPEVKKKFLVELDMEPWFFCRTDRYITLETLAKVLEGIAGIVISRGELALSTDPAMIPMLVKEFTQCCRQLNKIVMVASDLLSSMRFQSTPTRAEVSDVANAVMDGTDSVILAEDLSQGPYASQALSLCREIVSDIEKHQYSDSNWLYPTLRREDEMASITYHAYKTAERVDAKALVCITKHGNTAVQLGSYKMPFPIIAVTFSRDVQRKVSLIRGVSSLLLSSHTDLDAVLPNLKSRLARVPYLRSGDRIVFVTVTLSSLGYDSSNLFSVQTLE